MENDPQKIVEQFGRLVYSTAAAHMKNKEDAEDIFQEVFLTYVKKQPVFTTDEAARAWFTRTTVNHCRMLWRSKGRHSALPLDELSETASSDNEEEKRELLQALNSLPDKYRIVIIMHYYTGLTAKEIGKALRISENAVYTRLNRARKQLEDKLKD